MASTQRLRAANVCVTCKARKKKCDKALPTCGYCARKGWPCHYRRPKPGLPVAWLIQGTAARDSGVVGGPEVNPTHFSATPNQSENTLCLEAQRIIRTTGRYLDEISVRYFQIVQPYLPIISRNHFQTTLISCGATQEPEFAILLLAMCLITSQSSPETDVTSLYHNARSLFLQAQALCKPSLSLIQAGILLAVHESSRRAPEQALITIGGCVRMAHTAGLLRPTCPPTSGYSGTIEKNDEQIDEQMNTWWAMSIYERMFLCEQAVVDQPLVSKMPDITLTSSAQNHDAFYQAAQAAWILDHVLSTLSAPDSEDRHTRLQGVDLKLQRFLAMVTELSSSSGTSTVYCWAISVAIRALFLLHCRVLRDGQDGSERSANSSAVALDSLTRMVLDIADLHKRLSPSQVDALPPSCGYIIRVGLEYMQRKSCETDTAVKLLRVVDDRWGQGS
ncbi:hypothetical protein BJX62DRAFT_193847 [Aspergillus germanicus]